MVNFWHLGIFLKGKNLRLFKAKKWVIKNQDWITGKGLAFG